MSDGGDNLARLWLTADEFARRAGGGATAALAPNEFLTPAARDYALVRGIEVRRGAEAATAPPAPRPGPIGTAAQSAAAAPGHEGAGRVHPAVLTHTLGLVVHRADANVEAVLATLARDGVVTVGFAASNCPMCNTKEMCKAVGAGQLAGGIIIDRYAAGAMVLAGKIRGIRAVQAVSVAAAEGGLRQFDANVLVVGHAAVSVYEMRSMIVRFAAGRRLGRQRTALLEAVEELERQA